MSERNADVSKTLIDKWNKGELPDGFYWIEFKDGEITSTTFSNLHGFICCDSVCDNENIKQILEEMPSFEQWQEYKNANDSMFDTIKMLNKDNYKLEKENTKLKELLKQYKEDILNDCDWYIDAGEKIRQINQALGEE